MKSIILSLALLLSSLTTTWAQDHNITALGCTDPARMAKCLKPVRQTFRDCKSDCGPAGTAAHRECVKACSPPLDAGVLSCAYSYCWNKVSPFMSN
jgi:hypothetical protein